MKNRPEWDGFRCGPTEGAISAGIPTSVTVSVFGRLRLTHFLREPCFDGLETAGTPRRATTMLVGAIEPDEHPHIGGVSNIGRWVVKDRGMNISAALFELSIAGR